MADDADVLTVTEAAVIARVSVRDVHRAIDEHILPNEFIEGAGGRAILASGCPLIAFYFDSAKRLTADERLHVIGRLGPKLRKGGFERSARVKGAWTVRDAYLTVDIEPFLTAARERLVQLAAARTMVTSTKDVLGAVPVFKGTRVPVHDVAASLAAAVPRERVRAAYPTLTDEHIDLARLYAEAYPLRGRPRRELPERGVVLSDRRLTRRAAG